jgi:hypothetical protein
MIYSGKAIDEKIYDPLTPVNIPELSNKLNDSQVEAVNMALN